MGSNGTAITIPGGPRVIGVFDGNGAPSGPNYTLFVVADRRPGSLWVRSGGGVVACTAYAIDAAV